MPTIDCERDGCPRTIEVDPDADADHVRCGGCGRKHAIPEVFPDGGETENVSVPLDGGGRVEVDITINVHRGGS